MNADVGMHHSKNRSSLSNTIMYTSTIMRNPFTIKYTSTIMRNPSLGYIYSGKGLRMIVLVYLIVLLYKWTSCFHYFLHGTSLHSGVGTTGAPGAGAPP